MTGIQNLIFDPEYFGGGTHDNLHGQELDVHVDFNYHRSTKLHRRLNLIVYLNHNWNPEWGGSIEIHSNPRDPDTNTISSFAPIFNRCVIFETNEFSWHGFSQIKLPESMRHLSRKSMTIYYYTKNRPEHEIVPVHNTFYIQRPLPAEIRPGEVLSLENYVEIKSLLTKRDTWLAFYQNLEIKLNGELGNSKHYLSEIEGTIRPTTQGYITQTGKVSGYYPDRWLTPAFEGCFRVHRSMTGLTIDLRVAPGLPSPGRIQFYINEQLVTEPLLQPGERVSVPLPCTIQANDIFTLAIRSNTYCCPKELGINSDERKLVALVESISAQH